LTALIAGSPRAALPLGNSHRPVQARGPHHKVAITDKLTAAIAGSPRAALPFGDSHRPVQARGPHHKVAITDKVAISW